MWGTAALGRPVAVQQSSTALMPLHPASHVVQFPVMLSQELREILVCPACKQALEYREKPESLKCTQCRRVYPVKDDIPIMLIDEATVEP